MVTSTTHGVKISVETTYQNDFSYPENEHFTFSYQITIQNLSDYAIQLKRRQWFIFDSNGALREVEGEGVVGEQPILEPGESHSYMSGCTLTTDIGSMKGNYLMQRLFDDTTFHVEIPEFQLIVPYRLN